MPQIPLVHSHDDLFALDTVITDDDLNDRSQTSNKRRQTLSEEAVERGNLRFSLINWIKRRAVDMPFKALDMAQIAYLLQLDHDAAYPGVDLVAAGLAVPKIMTEARDNMDINQGLDPTEFFRKLSIDNGGTTFDALTDEFWNIGVIEGSIKLPTRKTQPTSPGE